MSTHRVLEETCLRRANLAVCFLAAKTLFIAALISVSFLSQSACSRTIDLTWDPPRIVLLYSTCTVNKEYLSPYNSDIPFTPRIQGFSDKSIVFERHQTEAGKSGIAYASIFTGSQAERHGAYRHPTRLSEDLYLVFEAFRDNGYDTYYWAGHPMARPGLNYAQGVDWNHIVEERLDGRDPEFLRILDRLKTDPEYRVFIATAFTATHAPYGKNRLNEFLKLYPEMNVENSKKRIKNISVLYTENRFELESNFSETVEKLKLTNDDIAELIDVVELLYKSRIWYLDQLFGEVLDSIEDAELNDTSIVAFTSDHGEALYRDNTLFKWSHGFQLAPEVLGVPLIVRLPRAPARRYEQVTRSIDVFPTLAGTSKLVLPEESAFDGVDLSRPLLREAPEPRLHAYSHTSVINQAVLSGRPGTVLLRHYYPNPDPELIWVSVRTGDTVFKWRNLDGANWGAEIFDLAEDPEETTNLFDPENQEHRKMLKALRDYKARLVAEYQHYIHTTAKEVERPDDLEEEIEALRSLGYIE